MATTPNFSFLESILENFALSRSFALNRNFVLGENFSLAAKEKTYPSSNRILRASESLSASLFQTLGVILLFTLLLQPLVPWLARPTTQNHTWEQTFPLPTSHQEKTISNYDAVSGSSLYCNGDPVNGLDPDGRCVEGGIKGYAIGSFAEYDNTAQAVGGFVGTLGSYITPGLGEYALARDIAGSAWHGLQAAGDMYNNGLNWRNGTTLGLSAVGVGLGGWAALAPARAAVEAIASTTSSSEINPFETMLAKVDELDFSTPRNGAVFYSGPGQGIRAASFATRTGGMTIDMTSGGQWLRENLDALSRAEQDLIWKRASIPFAKGASGKINAFIHGASPERAFRTIEEPILNANPNVYNSTYYY